MLIFVQDKGIIKLYYPYMAIFSDFLKWSLDLISTKPLISAATFIVTMGLPLLRHYHYLLVVHPSNHPLNKDVSGRHNN